MAEYPSTVHHIFAQRRSGHHAVIDQLLTGYEDAGVAALHINDVCRQPDTSDTDSIVEAAEGYGALIINYEDVSYGDRHVSGPYAGVRTRAEQATHHDMVLVRDWYNLAASRLFKAVVSQECGQYVPIQDVPWEETRRRWLEHASLASKEPDQPLVVRYNTWFSDPEYRAGLNASYGLPVPSDSVGQVARIGRGSSFDGLRFDGDAQKMNVLERWRDLRPDMLPAYVALVTDDEIDHVSRNVFGWGQRRVLGALAVQNLADTELRQDSAVSG